MLQVRLFICDNPACVVATFAEQVNGLTALKDIFMRLLRRAAWLATITTLLGATAALVAATSPAAPAAGPDGCVRIARLSPQAPAMDMFMYPFGNPGRPSC